MKPAEIQIQNDKTTEEVLVSLNQTISNPLVSVIVPCYNAAKILPIALKSLEYQTFKDFEVIVIDDGSSDNIKEVVNDYSDNSNLKIIFCSQSNSGVSAARNHGLKLSNGKYICFLDADDVYHRRFLERAVSVCEKDKIDTCLFFQDRNINNVLENDTISELNPEIICIEQVMEFFMYNKENIHFGGFLYRKEIIIDNDLSFSVGTKYGEDLEFVWKYLVNCKNGICFNDKVYGYYDNPSSAINTVRWEFVDLIEAMLKVEKYMNEKDCKFTDKFSSYMIPRASWTIAKTFAVGNRKDYYERFLEEYPVKDFMKKLYKSSRNLMLKISSAMFCISKNLYYCAVRIAYYKRKH